jgi:hypothetical protein
MCAKGNSSLQHHNCHTLARFVLLAAVIACGLVGAKATTAYAYNGPANYDACTPNPITGQTQPYNYEIQNLEQATLQICANIPYGTYGQTSGYTNVSWYDPPNSSQVWFYVQQNQDQYTQLQINGPSWGTGAGTPTGSRTHQALAAGMTNRSTNGQADLTTTPRGTFANE